MPLQTPQTILITGASQGIGRELAMQLAGKGVQITDVLPHTVETRMTAHRNVPKMQASEVAKLTIDAIADGKRSVLLGTGKLLGVLLYLVPHLAKRIMLKF
jgi:short-subunit dehydrogenase